MLRRNLVMNYKEELTEALGKLQESQVVKFNNRVVDLTHSLHRNELRNILKESYSKWHDGVIDALFESLIDIVEIKFKDKAAFTAYNSKHKMRKSTKVTIGGKETTAGEAEGGEKVKGKKDDTQTKSTGGTTSENIDA